MISSTSYRTCIRTTSNRLIILLIERQLKGAIHFKVNCSGINNIKIIRILIKMEGHHRNQTQQRFRLNQTSIQKSNPFGQFPYSFVSFSYESSSFLSSQPQELSSTKSYRNINGLQLNIWSNPDKVANIVSSIAPTEVSSGTAQDGLFVFLSILIINLKIFLKEYIENLQNITPRLKLETPSKIAKPKLLVTLIYILTCFLIPTQAQTLICDVPHCLVSDCVTCSQCEDRYSWDAVNNVCDFCKDTNCKQCTDPISMNVCSTCLDGCYRSNIGTCGICPSPCQNCGYVSSSLWCYSCVAGYALGSGGLCQTCANFIPDCNTCNSTTACTDCSSGFALVATTGGMVVCKTCDTSMNGCTQCSSATVCTQCNTITYFLKAGDTNCTLCSNSSVLTNCYICEMTGAFCMACLPNFMLYGNSSLYCKTCGEAVANCSSCTTNACIGCAAGFYLVSGSCLSCTTIDLNCQMCTFGTCSSCAVGYYLNGTCNSCSGALSNCTACSNPNTCTACINNTVLAWNGTAQTCKACWLVMGQCLSCTSINVCLTCNYSNGYYLHPTIRQCSYCQFAIPFCDRCPSQSVCDRCINTQYALTSTFQCQACGTLMSGCLTCTSYSICTTCASALFFLNTTDAHCHYCNSTQFQCKKCYFNTTTLAMRCTKCQIGFHLDSNYKCVCDSGKPIDGFCMDVVGCISAIAGPICTGCDVGMILRHGICVCPDDYWFVTDLCTNVVGCMVVKRTPPENTCLFCDLTLNFALGVDGLCHCKTYYEMVDGVCSQICGDGVLVNLPCDDGNTVSGDGCSSKCAVQSGFKCSVQNKTSKCVYTLKLTITLIKIEKIENFNSGRFIFEFKPAIATLNSMNWTNYVNVSVPGANFTITGSLYKSGKLYVNFNFGSSIQGLMAEMSINFDPSLFSISGYNFTFPIVSDGVRFVFLTKLETYRLMEYIFLALGGVALLIFVVSLPFHKMLGVQTLQVFQIFFILLLVIDSYEQVYNKLNVLGYTLGFTGFWKYDDDVALNTKLLYSRLGVVRQFVQNQALVLPIIIITSAIFIVYFIQFSQNIQQYQKLSKYLEGLMSQCSKWYRWLTFPIVVGFSYGSFLALYSQTSNTKEWKSEKYKEESNIISGSANMALILAFCFIYSSTFWAEMLIPLKSQISKALLSVERAKKWYVSQYLAYSFVLMSLLLGGYQISSCVSLLFLTFIVFAQLLIVIFNRPYYQGIHMFGIILNQTFLAIFCLCLLVRSIKIGQGSLYSEDDNFLLVILFMFLLAVVDMVALARLISAIRAKFKKSEQVVKPPSEEDLQETMLKTFRDQVKEYMSPIKGNKYLVENQLVQLKKRVWKEIQKERVINGVEEFELQLIKTNVITLY